MTVSVEDSAAGDASQSGHRPPGFKLLQIVLEGVRRTSRETDVITFRLPKVFRVLELSFVVCMPKPGKLKVPVYMRFYLDVDAGDPPGSVTIE